MGTIVGYRFHPTPEELTNHYLRKKRLDPDFSVQKIKEVNLYDYEPFELPGLFPVQTDVPKWYFFCEPKYKYDNSKRVNRRTRGGNWKVTGKKRDIKDKRKRVIGWKITLVFYKGIGNSKEDRTNWVMHEYHIKEDSGFKKEFVVVHIKRNPNTKHQAPLTPGGGIPSPDMASNSGNHNPEKNALQLEWQLQQEPQSLATQSLANQEISLYGISQLLPNQSFSLNRETQQVPDRVFCGNSQLLPNFCDQEEGHRRSQMAFQNEFCGQETGHSYSLSEPEDGGRNSQPAVHNEFLGQETGYSHPSDFNPSQPVTGNFVYYDGDETIAALLNDGRVETIDDLLNEFSSVDNGDYDFNSLCVNHNFIVPEENVPPVQMGSVV